jgi:copper(I)-binding protein
MLIGMKQAVKEGDKVAITLGFEDGSSKQVDAVVKKPEAPKAETMDHSKHEHKH